MCITGWAPPPATQCVVNLLLQDGVVDANTGPYRTGGPRFQVIHELFDVPKAVGSGKPTLDSIMQPLDASHFAIRPSVDVVLAADALEDGETHSKLFPCFLDGEIEKCL